MPSRVETIFLWGAPGVGKTTIGRRVARALQRAFIDTDALVVERAGLPIASIFAQLGEPAFRTLESEALASAAGYTGSVIALGGGAVLAAPNRALIRTAGRSIYLRASLATLEQRIAAQRVKRPVFATGMSVSTLLANRLPLYESADHSVDVDRRPLDEIVAEICGLL